MADSHRSFHLRVTRDNTTLPRLSGWTDTVVAGLGLTGRTAYALRLCIEEVVANLVMHGRALPDRDGGDIDLAVDRSGDQCVLTVVDRCVPFDPLTRDQPGNRRDRIGGAGLTLLRHYADHVDYHIGAEANRLTIRLTVADCGRL